MSFNQLSQGRTLAAAALFMAASASTGFAQCPADDATTTNNDCANAAPAASGLTAGLTVQGLTEDFWSISVPAGMVLTADILFSDVQADLDLEIFVDGTCTAFVDNGASTSDNETAMFDNFGGSAVTAIVHAFVWNSPMGSCGDYDMNLSFAPSTNPCATFVDDGEEENDSCPAAVVPSANPLAGLGVTSADADNYTITIPTGEILTVDLTFIDANGDVDCAIIDPTDCVTALEVSTSATDNEQLTFANTTGAPQTVVLNVILDNAGGTDCNNYDLAWSTAPDPCQSTPDDSFEENDDCANAAPITTGMTTGLFVLKETVDEDWFSITINDGATITAVASFIDANGDVDMDLYDACGNLVDESAGVVDTETVTFTNMSGAAVDMKISVFCWNNGFNVADCNTYDLDISVMGGGPGNVVPYCFGDGSGTACPCGNNSTAGHMGGCANSAGDGAVLTATGMASVAMDTLNLDLASATPTSFALLVSGNNQLPQMGACIGCGLPAFDGLRCAGGGFLRHGSRAIAANGETGNGWGPPGGPAGGLIAANGFTAGQTKNFFAFYRENMAAVCMTGQNSSNGVAITFQP